MVSFDHGFGMVEVGTTTHYRGAVEMFDLFVGFCSTGPVHALAIDLKRFQSCKGMKECGAVGAWFGSVGGGSFEGGFGGGRFGFGGHRYG
jgi:hypothetical protein